MNWWYSRYQPKGQGEELEAIREGNESLRKRVMSRDKARVWMQHEVEALNFYLENREEVHDAILNGKHLYTPPEPRLAPRYTEEIDVSMLWVTRVRGYYLYAGLIEDGRVLHWLSVRSEPNQLAFCIEEWEEWEASS